MKPAYVTSVRLKEEQPIDRSQFPGCLAFTRELEVDFTSAVTFFVGENGSGKSTLLEAMAVLSGMPSGGGGTNDFDADHELADDGALAASLRLGFIRRPKDGYFFRAEMQSHFASLLDRRGRDPYFLDNAGVPADPYQRYGGKSLHQMSHGEAFLAVMKNRFSSGLFFLDEPESALSPQRQLALLAIIHELFSRGQAQFFIATHSPILMTFPAATILSFDRGKLEAVCLEETSHYQITRRILARPSAYWDHLVDG